MNIKKKSISTLLCISLVTLLSGSVFANEQSVADQGAAHAQNDQRLEHKRECQHMRLNKLADRLEIKASQQTAWEAYAKSVETVLEKHSDAPSRDADAATIAHYRADRAADFAKKLAGIADATANLQMVLTADQQKVFNEASHFSHHRMEHGMVGHCGMGGKPAGHEKKKNK